MAAPRTLFAIGRIPHRHLFITSLSQSDSRYPVDRWASSKAALAISVFHKTASPIHCQHIWAPQRESGIAEARPGCHFLHHFRWGDKEMSDMGWQLEHTKAVALTSLVTFKALTKNGTEERCKQFYSQFLETPQINTTWRTQLTDLLLSTSGKKYWLTDGVKERDKYSVHMFWKNILRPPFMISSNFFLLFRAW